jgi:hypothetical protein
LLVDRSLNRLACAGNVFGFGPDLAVWRRFAPLWTRSVRFAASDNGIGWSVELRLLGDDVVVFPLDPATPVRTAEMGHVGRPPPIRGGDHRGARTGVVAGAVRMGVARLACAHRSGEREGLSDTPARRVFTPG